MEMKKNHNNQKQTVILLQNHTERLWSRVWLDPLSNSFKGEIFSFTYHIKLIHVFLYRCSNNAYSY